jgi:hypothetical protein
VEVPPNTGNKEEALADLEKAYAEHSMIMTTLKVDPAFDRCAVTSAFKTYCAEWAWTKAEPRISGNRRFRLNSKSPTQIALIGREDELAARSGRMVGYSFSEAYTLILFTNAFHASAEQIAEAAGGSNFC